MQTVGWEIRPAGWITLIVLAIVIIYFLTPKPQPPKEKAATNPLL